MTVSNNAGLRKFSNGVKNDYLPKIAMIEDVRDEAYDVKTFTLRLVRCRAGLNLPYYKDDAIRYRPGQFIILSLPGYGEAPFTFASSNSSRRLNVGYIVDNSRFQVSVKKIGSLTNALCDLKPKDLLGVRGPYGNWFPLDKMKKKDILFVAGGIGMAPLRSAIQHVFKNRKGYGKVEIVYGSRTPQDILYKDEIESWRVIPDTEVHLTVDVPDDAWGGTCGVVCVLFPKVKLKPRTAIAVLCGPPVMIKFAVIDILKLGFRKPNIYASLERYMKCGIGKCGHCYIKDRYVCLDGPNFSYPEMKRLGIES